MARFRLPLLVLLAGILLASGFSAFAVQEIKERLLITAFLRENLTGLKQLFRTSHDMIQEAKPFGNRHHQNRYRFSPGEKNGRLILSTARAMSARFRLLQGTLCYAPMQGRDELFKIILESLDQIVTFGKRGLRAVKDGNYALYMASAQGIEKEAFSIDLRMKDLEVQINKSIAATDAMKEDL